MSRSRAEVALIGLVLAAPNELTGQAAGAPFQFSREAGAALHALWNESVASQQERVACLGGEVTRDTAYVICVLPLQADGADSLGIFAAVSIDTCGPPAWLGIAHTHIAPYSEDGQPSRRFSGADRGVMRLWYDRWKADGVFCVLYSESGAHCEADGVIGGMRSRPRIVR